MLKRNMLIILFVLIICLVLQIVNADLYAGGNDNAGSGLVGYYDGSWNLLPNPGFYDVNSVAVDSNIVYAGGNDNAGSGLVGYYDGSWNMLPSPGFYTVTSVDIDVVNDLLYIAGNDNAGTGLVAYYDNGWNMLPSPGFYTVNSVAVFDDIVYIGGNDNAGTGLVAYYDGSWNMIPNSGFYTVTSVAVSLDGILYASGNDNAGTGLTGYYDNGWNMLPSPGFYTINSVVVNSTDVLYAGGDDNAGTGLIAYYTSWDMLANSGFYTVNSIDISYECGNNIIEPGEVCDGSDLDEKDCLDFGYDKGTLGCLSDCSDFDTNYCYDEKEPTGPGGGGGCFDRWDCSEWSECTGTQTRTCTYTGTCAIHNGKPAEQQDCIPAEKRRAGQTCFYHDDCEGLYCIDGVCAEAGCFYDNDCPADEICDDYECVKKSVVTKPEKLGPAVGQAFALVRWNTLWLILVILGIVAIVLYMILHHEHMPPGAGMKKRK